MSQGYPPAQGIIRKRRHHSSVVGDGRKTIQGIILIRRKFRGHNTNFP